MSLSVADRKKVIDAWVVAAKTTGLHIQVQVGGAPLADVTELVSYTTVNLINIFTSNIFCIRFLVSRTLFVNFLGVLPTEGALIVSYICINSYYSLASINNTNC